MIAFIKLTVSRARIVGEVGFSRTLAFVQSAKSAIYPMLSKYSYPV